MSTAITDSKLADLQEKLQLAQKHHADAKEALDKSDFERSKIRDGVAMAHHEINGNPAKLEEKLPLTAERLRQNHIDFVVTQRELEEAEEALKKYEASLLVEQN